jgi:ABC-type transport system involved in multi-copper enzyme maturation permease subunit
MIAKEWRDARWKLGLGAVLLFGILLRFPVPTPYGDILKMVGTWPVGDPASGKPAPVDLAMEELSIIYGVGGGLLLALLALLMGVSLISSEVDNNTIFLLLSRPVSRTRALLTKYATGASVLLFSAVAGGGVLFAVAAIKGYPLGSVDVAGAVLSVVLLWLGSLFVLGMALLFSVLLRGAIKSFVAAGVAVFLFLSPDNWMNYFLWDEYHALGLSEGFPRDVTLFYYWFSTRSFLGEGLAVTDFLVCLIAAAVPLLLALWVFRRKAY